MSGCVSTSDSSWSRGNLQDKHIPRAVIRMKHLESLPLDNVKEVGVSALRGPPQRWLSCWFPKNWVAVDPLQKV